MRDGAEGRILLSIARAELLATIVPALPPEHHYLARMIASAMAIAGRELADDGAAAAEVRALIGAVYAADPAAGPPPFSEQPLADLERRLAADLRARRFGPAAEVPLGKLFDRQLAARLSLANPRYLARPG
ncbi:MAG: DUF6285 domain-containing protein [Acetobacteraceae bacterium]